MGSTFVSSSLTPVVVFSWLPPTDRQYKYGSDRARIYNNNHTHKREGTTKLITEQWNNHLLYPSHIVFEYLWSHHSLTRTVKFAGQQISCQAQARGKERKQPLGGDCGCNCCQNVVWSASVEYRLSFTAVSTCAIQRHTHIVVRVCIDIMMYTNNV
jgi:hypothetical protein